MKIDRLKTLKSYTDTLSYGQRLFSWIINNKSGGIGIRSASRNLAKYLNNQHPRGRICSSYLLSKREYRKIRSKCNESYFNTCPLTFGNYRKIKNLLLDNFEKVLGKEWITKTDCKNFKY